MSTLRALEAGRHYDVSVNRPRGPERVYGGVRYLGESEGKLCFEFPDGVGLKIEPDVLAAVDPASDVADDDSRSD